MILIKILLNYHPSITTITNQEPKPKPKPKQNEIFIFVSDLKIIFFFFQNFNFIIIQHNINTEFINYPLSTWSSIFSVKNITNNNRFSYLIHTHQTHIEKKRKLFRTKVLDLSDEMQSDPGTLNFVEKILLTFTFTKWQIH